MASDLKVVGASWLKTRISSMILIGAGLLAIGAFFIANMERPQFDGTYCATAYWSKQAGFKVEYWKQQNDLDNIPLGVGRICYKDSTLENGWSQLEVETQRNYPDWVQAYAAGLLEGTLTWSRIYDQWQNTIASSCDRDDNSQNFCTWLRDTLSASYVNVKNSLDSARRHDHFWHQIHLFYYQLEGLKAGFKNGAGRSRFEGEIPADDFLLMNAAADMHDLKIYFENYVMRPKEGEAVVEKNFLIPGATMVAKLVENEENGVTLLMGHSSVGSYSAMLRVFKRYKLRYHFTDSSKGSLVPGTEITFTGYPGILASTDDFYNIRGRHVNCIVAGVGIKNDNLKLWKNVVLKDAIPLVARVMAANRLAQQRRSWARIMSRYPFTGNKQWTLIDLKKMDMSDTYANNDSSKIKVMMAQTIPQKGFFWIVEQLPGRLHAEDVTDIFYSNDSIWSGNGVPYIDDILEASGLTNDHNLSRKAVAFNITDLNKVEKFLRLNSFRGDLQGDQSIPFGNIDLKMFSYGARFGNSDFHAIAGPIHIEHHRSEDIGFADPRENEVDTSSDILGLDESKKADIEIFSDRRLVRDDIRALALQQVQGPFKWSQAHSSFVEVKHSGHPDSWNFNSYSPKWAWHN